MIRIYKQPATVLRVTRLALKHKLYVEGWSAFRLFNHTIEEDEPPAYHMAFKWVDGSPIAWCLKFSREYKFWRTFEPGDCWRYTMPVHRRHGIGKQLWKALGGGQTFGPHNWDLDQAVTWDNVNTSHENQVTV